jgi:DNA polymerase-1
MADFGCLLMAGGIGDEIEGSFWREMITSMTDSIPANNTDKKRLILIDGHSLAFRVYYGLERTNMRTSGGHPVWAVYGFLNSLFRLLQRVQPDAMAVAFDVSKHTFRTRQYAEYKANRDSMPEDMSLQMADIRRSVELLGLPVYELNDYEADDVIGTLSQQAVKEGYHVDILTGDQDAFQLVDDGNVHVLIPPRTPKDELKTYTRDAVFEKMGVWPEQVIDFKGLKGDTSDNIPGVPGVGDKTASKLLAEFTTLEAVYENLDTQKGKLLERLTDNKDQAFLSKELATICREAPVTGDFEHATLTIPDLEALFDFFDTLEFKQFRRDAVNLLRPFMDKDAKLPEEFVLSPQTIEASDANGQSSLFASTDMPAATSTHLTVPFELIQTEAALTAYLDKVKQAGIVAIDLETTGLDVHQDQLVGLSLAIYTPEASTAGWTLMDSDTVNPLNVGEYPSTVKSVEFEDVAQLTDDAIEAVYIPIAHVGTDEPQLSEGVVLEALKPLLADPYIVTIAHNAKFEINKLRALEVHFDGLVIDTMVASYVDKPEGRHGLKGLSERILGQPMQEITELIGKGKKQIPFSEAEFEPACAYGACDSWVTLKLAKVFLERLSYATNQQKAALFYELELPLVKTLATMEYNGIALDEDYLADYSNRLGDQLTVLEGDIHKEAGLPFNINSPKQVGELLFDRMGIEPVKKTKGKTGYSTDAKVLEKLAEEYPIVQKILDYRQLAKLKSTYVDSLPALVNGATGRLHSSFNQTIVATGRLSSSDPNLQNIPIRTEEGRQIRRAFLAASKHSATKSNFGHELLLSADYSQIELRMLAHVSEDPNLMEAFNAGLDIHQATAALVFDVELEDVTKEQRYQAKTVNFGVIYGQTPHGLGNQLGISWGEAKDFIERYFEQYPKVQSTIERIQAEAKLKGYVTTLFGRVRDLSGDLASSNRSVREFAERAAFNTVLQGSAADLMKLAMLRLDNELAKKQLASRLLLQVHDEVVLGAPKNELEQLKTMVADAMALTQPLKVPLIVDMEVGENWMEQD